MKKQVIRQVSAREIVNGRGIPAVEAEIVLTDGTRSAASCPSGTSMSSHEAVEVRDGGARLSGKGVLKAVSNINNVIAKSLQGKDASNQRAVDELLVNLDGTPTKSKLGGNAITAVSLAVARAAATSLEVPVYKHLRSEGAYHTPIIAMNLISGSTTAKSKLDFEDYLVVPHGFDTVRDALMAGVEIFNRLHDALQKKHGLIPQITALAPPFKSNRQALDALMKAIAEAGFEGKVALALDVAADLMYDETNRTYGIDGSRVSTDELIEYYGQLVKEYPFAFIEDGLHEDDMDGFAELTNRVPCLIVGDDLFATNTERLKRGIQKGACNAMLLKINQAGTITEALDAAAVAKEHDYVVVASTRSGETEDPIQAHTAVAADARLMKLGAPIRGEMVAKYNEFMRIEELADGAVSFWGNQWNPTNRKSK